MAYDKECQRVQYIWQQVNGQLLEAGKMGKRKNLNYFDKGHIVMARRQDKGISVIAFLVGCCRYAVVCTH